MDLPLTITSIMRYGTSVFGDGEVVTWTGDGTRRRTYAEVGRGLIPSDAIDGQDPQPVTVLGYKFWQRHFNSDPAVLGQTLQLVHKTYSIVGVAAPRFTWEDGDVYLPLKVTQDPAKAYYVGVRLKPGVTHEAANAALQPLLEQFAKDTPKHFPCFPIPTPRGRTE